MWNKLFNSVDNYKQGLNAAWMRNEVINNNLANVETPGFKTSDVRFEEYMAGALSGKDTFPNKVTRPKHIVFDQNDLGEVTPVVTRNDDLSMRMDGNNVDVEGQMARLAQNSVQYYTYIEKLNSEFRRLKIAMGSGK